MLVTILAFIFVFTIITLAHEGGHLIFSKRAGIQVHEFGLGFGPVLFVFKKDETTYKLHLLPILGYVSIAGTEGNTSEEQETPEAKKYYNKKTSQKFMSVFSGPLMNLILGFFLFALVFSISGMPIGISNEIGTVSPGFPAAKIGLQPGDRLIAINQISYAKPEEAINFIHANAGKELRIEIDRKGQNLSFKAAPVYHARLKAGILGFALKPVYKKIDPLTALYYGFKATLELSLGITLLLGQLLMGKLSLSDLAGPVGIAQVTGQYAQNGFLSLLNFTAFFSINVAVLNLLPIPALDGGRICFILLEAIRRKPVPIEIENRIHQVGLTVLLGLIALLTVNDVLRLFKH